MEAAEEVCVPISLLASSELQATHKVIWLALQLDAHLEQDRLFSPTRLAKRIGLSRPTIRKARAKLIAEGWYAASQTENVPPRKELSGRRVVIPAELIMSTDVKAQAKVVYGVLQAMPRYHNLRGVFTYATLAKKMKLDAKTVKRAVCHLTELGWLKVQQANKHAPIHFHLCNPVRARHIAELLTVQRRLDKALHHGEALMQATLSALFDSQSFQDGATPNILVNPTTGETLEYDRFYYQHLVAFEFNGQQHYSPTEWFDEKMVAAQKERDQIKQRLSKDQNVTLIVITGEELCWRTLMQKVGKLLPLRRGVHLNRMLVNYLETRCRSYRWLAKRGWSPTNESTPELAVAQNT